MRITLVLKETIYDCRVKITDSKGCRDYFIPCLCDEVRNYSSVTVVVFDDAFSLSLVPIITDNDALYGEIEERDWKDKLAKKASKYIFDSLDKMILKVGCDYRVKGLQDGDRLDISMQNYVYGTLDRFDILGLVPMCYAFFEVSSFNERFELENAFETNRREVIKFAKGVVFSEILGDGLLSLITYPIQVNRIKYLSKNKKIFKTLKKFNSLDEIERQKFLEKQEKFF